MIDSDLILVIGIILAVLSIPAMLSAFSESRAPRAPIVTILIAGAMILYAVKTHPGGYAISDVPHVFFEVVGRIIN